MDEDTLDESEYESKATKEERAFLKAIEKEEEEAKNSDKKSDSE